MPPRRGKGGPLKLVVVAIAIGLIVSGVFLVLTDVRVDDRVVPLFDDDIGVPASSAGGTVSIDTILRDKNGEIVRRTDPYQPSAANLIDPVSDTQISSYETVVNWETSGSELDWSTLSVSGELLLTRVVGVDEDLNPISNSFFEIIGSTTITGKQIGDMNFIANLDILMPETLYYFDTSVTGAPAVHVHQKTPEPHAITFVFDGLFSASVADSWGNVYDSEYSLYIELRLIWGGSSFDVTWGEGDTPVTTTTTTTTTTTPPAKPVEPPLETSIDMTNLKSNEFISIEKSTDGVTTASMFGGTMQEDIGVVIIGAGLILFALAILIPSLPRRR